MTRVIITGGGTAGHTNPGIAVGEALLNEGLEHAEILFVGGERGNERELVPAAGFAIELLPGRGILRSVAPAALRQNASSALALLSGLTKAVKINRDFRPDVVLCLGGYAAFASSLAALVTRTPIIVTEQNARASAVNRLFGRFAKASALPYPDTDLPRGLLTGNPIRKAVVEAMQVADKKAARRDLGLPQNRTVVAVWAGSLGATSINEATANVAKQWANRSDVALYHVVGRRDWAAYRDSPETGSSLHHQVVEYEDRMPLLLAAADLAVCRGGASTAAELAVAGLPSILVPLPSAPRDHQRANGRELVEAGGAVQLDDGLLKSATGLYSELVRLVEDPEQLETMSVGAKSVARPNAARDVARLVLRNAK